MLKYIRNRLFQLILVAFGVSFLTFFVTTLTPSDAAEMYYRSMGVTPSQEDLERTREEFGLNRPLMVRYADWLGGVFRGDFGESLMDGENIMTKFLRKLPKTIQLSGVTLIFVLLVSIPIGILSARYHNKIPDNVARAISFCGVAMPGFWMALVIMFIFGAQLKLLPIVVRDDAQSIIMPMLSLGIPLACAYIRQIRTAVLEEMSGDYIMGIRSRGVSEKKILFGHVLPNAMSPIVNMLGLSIGALLGGSTIVEAIYNWNGIGNMVVNAITNRDYPIIQCYVLWMAIIYVSANLVVDISHYLMNPELRIKETAR